MTSARDETAYLPFELLIGALTANGYPVTVVDSPAGDGEARCILRVDAELQDALAVVEAGGCDQTFLIELGTFFFGSLFTGDVATLYHTSLGMARAQAKRLRIRLRMTPPELAALPWEYLYDGKEDAFLATSPETALVRYVPISLPVRPTKIKLPLRVLVVIASPRDVQALAVDKEKALVQAALAEGIEQGRIHLEIVEQAQVADISQALRRFQPHVFHFIGHGQFAQEGATLLLEDENGNAAQMDERTFRELFNGCQETRLAVLNACQTATVSSSQPLVGLAPRLLQRQLSAVVAMQYPILDRTSLIFTREFYRSLALGMPVDAAISEARRGIFVEGGGQSADWGTPVLFLRAKDGLLFQVEAPAAQALEIPAPPEPTRPPEILGFVGRAVELSAFAETLLATHLAVIAGMAGVGKTALATKLIEWVADDRDRVFWHSFHEGEGIDAILWRLAGFLAWHGRTDLWRLLQSARLTGGKPPPSETLFDYVLQLSRGGHFLFCLDDFHHVDDDPILNQLVERLRQALVAGELSLILTSRRVPDFVPLATFKALEGLSVSDTRQLLVLRGIHLTAVQLDELYKYTDGNAEFLTLAINALQQAKNPDLLISRLAESDDIERYLLQEVDETLTGQERGVMNAVAVLLGYAGTRNAIEQVLNGGNVFRTLRRLTERHLLTARDGEAGREYLQHAIVQTFYYEQNSLRERRNMQRRAGEYYEREEIDLLRAGLYFERAGEYQHAARLATQDVWSIINRGQARGLNLLLERFQPAQLDVPGWVEVNLARGLTYDFLGNRDLARQRYEIVLGQFETVPNQLELRKQKARVCQGMGELLDLEDPQAALTWFQEGLAVLQEEKTLEYVSLTIKVGTVYMQLADYATARAYLQAGLNLMSSGPSQLRSAAYLNLGSVCFYLGQLAEARTYIQEALTISQQLHDHFQRVNLLNVIGFIEYTVGEWRIALNHYETALAVAKNLGGDQLLASIQVNVSAIYIAMGDDAVAGKHLQSCYDLAEQHQYHLIKILALFRFADMQIRNQQWREAIAHLEIAKSLATTLEEKGSLVAIYSAFAETHLGMQEVTTALAYANQAVELAQEIGEKLDEGIAERIRGDIYALTGEKDQAHQSFETSLSLLGDKDPYETARTKVRMGVLLRQHCQQDEGLALIAQAVTAFQQLGANRDLLAAKPYLEGQSL